MTFGDYEMIDMKTHEALMDGRRNDRRLLRTMEAKAAKWAEREKEMTMRIGYLERQLSALAQSAADAKRRDQKLESLVNANAELVREVATVRRTARDSDMRRNKAEPTKLKVIKSPPLERAFISDDGIAAIGMLARVIDMLDEAASAKEWDALQAEAEAFLSRKRVKP